MHALSNTHTHKRSFKQAQVHIHTQTNTQTHTCNSFHPDLPDCAESLKASYGQGQPGLVGDEVPPHGCPSGKILCAETVPHHSQPLDHKVEYYV